MATEFQAEFAFKKTREFFNAKLGALKSGNKTYSDKDWDENFSASKLVGASLLSQGEALTRVHRRNEATQLVAGKGSLALRMKGFTPLAYGAMIASHGNATGNCGVMACVAMHYARLAHVPAHEMWLIEALNSTTKGRKIYWGLTNTNEMSFGHSWALLGREASQQYIVDPWAGVWCKKQNFEQEFRNHMNKWVGQGKRIWVGYKDGDSFWANANHAHILSLFGPGATLMKISGEQFFENP